MSETTILRSLVGWRKLALGRLLERSLHVRLRWLLVVVVEASVHASLRLREVRVVRVGLSWIVSVRERLHLWVALRRVAHHHSWVVLTWLAHSHVAVLHEWLLCWA